MRKSPLRRVAAQGVLVFLFGALCACTPPPVVVSMHVPQTVAEQPLSLQVTGKKSPLGFVSPNGRYAKLIRKRLANRLIEEGYVVKPTEGQTHVHVEVERITTGGTANRADCELHVTAYDGYPGDLVASKGKLTNTAVQVVFEFEVRVSKKGRSQGYSKELLADEAATEAVDLIVGQLPAPVP